MPAEASINSEGAGLDQTPANILLVDDRRANLIALSAILEPLEQNLFTATSGEDALRHLLQREFAAILMDVQMPDLNGFETVSIIKSRQSCRHIPVIFVTAQSRDVEFVYRGYSAGAVDYISKPFNPDILRSKISVFIELYKKEREIIHQSQLLARSILREAEQKQIERERALEQRHLQEVAVELEARVAERTRELTEANRELEGFCYSIAHDLRSPLRDVVTTSAILLQDASPQLSENEIRLLQMQTRAAQRMGLLIDDLLRLYRLGRKELSFQEVDLSALTTEIMIQSAPPEPHPYKFDVEQGLLASGDPGLIAILMQNIVENAFKYSPNGGNIRFGRRTVDDRDAFFLSDEGIGFDMRYERKLFQPFERLVPDGDYPGTGIGLAMVQKIVQKHGGSVWAESEVNKGTTIYFALDLEEPASVQVAQVATD